MSSAPPALVPINHAAGDFPPDRPTTFTDGYGRSQVLVPIEQLREAEARAQRASATEDRLAASCDRLMVERDAARAESRAKVSYRSDYARVSAEHATALTRLRQTADLVAWLAAELGDIHNEATLIDLVQRYADEQCAATKVEGDLWRQAVDGFAALTARIKAGELEWDGSAWVEPVVEAVVIDHTDPEQIRRAAGVIEGIAMDEGSPRPHATMVNAAGLRHRAEQIEARS
ncbi:hypothetical protein PP515_gp58 [Gordonia phage Sidious]|uniref:Uncharacterized protein n=1 Tax=Gordonia phage Sidious TaxID=2591118 RepID=A0A515MI98_9CAUD|nr:hypothetical protein PP515_gp58 [Gordonia phage Sidious]QDM56405.1 hypothetical protein SEA_SIDIOUS_58 [Gordonia phage Sidious]